MMEQDGEPADRLCVAMFVNSFVWCSIQNELRVICFQTVTKQNLTTFRKQSVELLLLVMGPYLPASHVSKSLFVWLRTVCLHVVQ